MATLGIFLFALILQGLGKLSGVNRKLRLRAFQISIVAFVVVITILHVVLDRGMRIYWDDVVFSFLPALTAPIVAFLASLVWPRKEGD